MTKVETAADVEETPVERATYHILLSARLARRGYSDRQILEIALAGERALTDATLIWVANLPTPAPVPAPKPKKRRA